MAEIRCPDCNSPMVLRTARRGTNAGSQFYGCSRFPKCRRIIPLDDVHPNSLVVEKGIATGERSPTESFFPRTLIARTRFQNYQVRFLETVAVPEDLLKRIRFGDAGQGILEAFSQWRIDFPIGESPSTLNEGQRQIVSVAEKILARGKITLLSSHLEQKLNRAFPKASKSELSLPLLESMVLRGYQRYQKKPWLDSPEESVFYEDILPALLGRSYGQWVLSQVEFSSLLLPNPNVDITGSQRVDFAILHPRLDKRIIVEIDGEQHKRHIDSDKERDISLQDNGYTVVRIPASEIQDGSGHQLSVLRSTLSTIAEETDKDRSSSKNENEKFILSVKLAHQIQIVLLQAIQSGFLNLADIGSWHIVADPDEVVQVGKKKGLSILENSVTDFVELLRKLGNLYTSKVGTAEPTCILSSDYTVGKSANAIHISFSDKYTNDLPTFHMQNIYFPFHIANSSFPAAPLVRGGRQPEEKDLKYFLQYLFRKPSFWEGQCEGITRAFQGEDTLVLLPTGAGKSLLYQLASLLLPGRTVVIDPIISLIDDQIDNLAMMGIDRCIGITSQTHDISRAIQLFGQGEYLFAYVAPERFQVTEFRESLRTLTVHTPIALIVVDEAHCVSEWGHDFRTAYLNIGRTTRAYCESDGHAPPMIALTGTASRAVLKDVQRELQIEEFDAIITPKTFDRAELEFNVIRSTSQEKFSRLIGYLGQKLPSLFNVTGSTLYQTREDETYSGLIFCPWVNGEFGVVHVADEISTNCGISTAYYSGGRPRNWMRDDYDQTKRRTASEFKRNKIPLLVCTKAFGMGIDKPNIRYTIHFGMPPSIESFYQEAGRAGRDRRMAHCSIIISNDDIERSKELLNPNTTVEEIDGILSNTSREEDDDITRNLYFHIRAFRGIAHERQDVEEVLVQLGNISSKAKRILTIPDKIGKRVEREIQNRQDVSRRAREIVEKALHRLLLLGVVSDYTIDYSKNEFTVSLAGLGKGGLIEKYGEYVSGFVGPKRREVEMQKAREFLQGDLSGFISRMIELLLQFIYSNIERGRRQAMREMLECSQKTRGNEFRKYLDAYWGRGDEFGHRLGEAIDEILHADDIGVSQAKEIVEDMGSPREAAEIRGAMARNLESYPDQPVLRMLRAISEMYTRDNNHEIARENFAASISSARTNYGLSDAAVAEFASWAVLIIGKRDKQLANELVTEVLHSYPNRDFARRLIEHLPITLAEMPAWFLLANVQENCRSLVLKKGG